MTDIYCDGGCSGNGTARARAYGSFAVDAAGEELIVHRFEYTTARTNNQAEYRALIDALEYALDKGIQPCVFMDSQLVVEQTNGRWRVKIPDLLPLRVRAYELLRKTGGTLEWCERDKIFAVLGH